MPNVSINCKLEELRVMEVEVVSKDYVKPCRPTPPELRIYRVSLLDQLMLTAHVPIIVFYDRPTMFSTEEALRRLKSSASEALPDFYPFAGRIKDDLCIDCNDAGVYYTEARVNCSVRDLIGKPDGQLIQKLLPAEPDDQSSEGIHIVMVQVNEFTCGGIAIAAYLSHKIIDGPTIVTLLKAWSSTARGRPGEVKPSFVAPSIFPQSDKLTSDYLLGIWPALLKVGKYATRRFVFDTEAVAKIKAGAASPSLVAHPTRVESVSAFIWRCCMRAAEARDGSRNPSVLTHMINLRLGKAGDEGPIPEHTIGNLLWVITARSEPEAERDLKPLTAAIREGFLGIRAEMFEQFAGEDGASRMQECLEEIRKVFKLSTRSFKRFVQYGIQSFCTQSFRTLITFRRGIGFSDRSTRTRGLTTSRSPACSTWVSTRPTSAGGGRCG